jgi:hypothetical protein
MVSGISLNKSASLAARKTGALHVEWSVELGRPNVIADPRVPALKSRSSKLEARSSKLELKPLFVFSLLPFISLCPIAVQVQSLSLFAVWTSPMPHDKGRHLGDVTTFEAQK